MYAQVLDFFKWKKVAVIYYDDEFTLNVCMLFMYHFVSAKYIDMRVAGFYVHSESHLMCRSYALIDPFVMNFGGF